MIDNDDVVLIYSPQGNTASGPSLQAESVMLGNGVAFNLNGIDETTEFDRVLIDTSSGISGGFGSVTVGGFNGTVQSSFDQLSGEVQAAVPGLLLAHSRFVRDAISRRIGAAFNGVGAVALPVMAYGQDGIEFAPATTDRFALWSQAFAS